MEGKAISDDAPCDYFGKVLDQCKSGDLTIGNIADKNELDENLKALHYDRLVGEHYGEEEAP